jgi:hypothetical protein
MKFSKVNNHRSVLIMREKGLPELNFETTLLPTNGTAISTYIELFSG